MNTPLRFGTTPRRTTECRLAPALHTGGSRSDPRTETPRFADRTRRSLKARTHTDAPHCAGSAVSGTVGLGNIAGVAVAVSVGGPGATFWMILCGLLGMATKFV